MIAAVLDTNVLAAGFRGVRHPASTPGQLIRAWQARRFELAVSQHVLDELRRAFATRYFTRHLSAEQIAAALTALAEEAPMVPLAVAVYGVTILSPRAFLTRLQANAADG